MPLWPNNRVDLFGYWPLTAPGNPSISETLPRRERRMDAFTGPMVETSSHPNGMAPTNIWLPLVAGGMNTVNRMAYTGTGSLLQGAPMQAAAAVAFTSSSNAALVVSMAMNFLGDFSADASLRLTLGMQINAVLAMTADSNMSLIVPFSASGTMAFTGASDLRGDLSMAAEWGGAAPLSAEGLADAVWGRIVESGFTAEEILRILAAVAAGNASGLNSSPSFTGLDGSTTRVAATLSGESRNVSTVDGS